MQHDARIVLCSGRAGVALQLQLRAPERSSGAPNDALGRSGPCRAEERPDDGRLGLRGRAYERVLAQRLTGQAEGPPHPGDQGPVDAGDNLHAATPDPLLDDFVV